MDDDEDVEVVLVVWLGSNSNLEVRGGLKYKKDIINLNVMIMGERYM